MDIDGLVEDIQSMVAHRIQSSIPDDGRLMMDLVSQINELTGEVRQLRRELETKPYVMFNGQMMDISAEIAEIHRLLESKTAFQQAGTSILEPSYAPPYTASYAAPSAAQPRTSAASYAAPSAAQPRTSAASEAARAAAQPRTSAASEAARAAAQPQWNATAQAASPAQAAQTFRASAAAPTMQPTAPAAPPAQAAFERPTGVEKRQSEDSPAAVMQDVDELRKAFADTEQQTEPKKRRDNHAKTKEKSAKKKTVISIIGDIFFYIIIIGIVVGAFLLKTGSGGQPSMIAGYSGMTVLTSSMEDVYPKGSLIITRRVDADELQIGDDITFMINESSSVTHRIIGITESYLDTGERAFETQGTMNDKPDKEPVAAANVVGKVIFCSKAIGQLASFVTENWPIILFSVVVIGGLIAFLKWNFQREDESPPRHARKRERPGDAPQ